jgi:hypothetical protein
MNQDANEGLGSGHQIKKRGPNICASYKPVKENIKAPTLPCDTILLPNYLFGVIISWC